LCTEISKNVNITSCILALNLAEAYTLMNIISHPSNSFSIITLFSLQVASHENESKEVTSRDDNQSSGSEDNEYQSQLVNDKAPPAIWI
jgi:hypothetical protein